VDRGGFPLEIGCFEGNKAETATLLPVIQAFHPTWLRLVRCLGPFGDRLDGLAEVVG
jgi:hypothetical protein